MLRSSGEVAKLYEAHTVMVVYSWKETEGTISALRPWARSRGVSERSGL